MAMSPLGFVKFLETSSFVDQLMTYSLLNEIKIKAEMQVGIRRIEYHSKTYNGNASFGGWMDKMNSL